MTKPKQYLVCPHCGNDSGFTSNETVLATADVNSFSIDPVYGNITPDYAGESDVHWDTQEQVKEGIYNCNYCGEGFDRPIQVTRTHLYAIRAQWKTLQVIVQTAVER